MTTSRWLGILLLFYLVFLAVTAPARLAARFLPPGVSADGYLGTLWSGHVDRLQTAAFVLGPVEWRVQPHELLLGCLAAHVRAGLPGGRFEARASRCLSGTSEITDLEGDLPAALLAQAAARQGVALEGRVRPRISRVLVVDAWPVALEGEVRWTGARLLAPVEMTLGELVARLGVRGARILVDLDDAGGPLDLEGQLVLVRDGTWHIEGSLLPRRNADDNLRQALSLLGRPDPEGRYHFESGGQLQRH